MSKVSEWEIISGMTIPLVKKGLFQIQIIMITGIQPTLGSNNFTFQLNWAR